MSSSSPAVSSSSSSLKSEILKILNTYNIGVEESGSNTGKIYFQINGVKQYTIPIRVSQYNKINRGELDEVLKYILVQAHVNLPEGWNPIPTKTLDGVPLIAFTSDDPADSIKTNLVPNVSVTEYKKKQADGASSVTSPPSTLSPPPSSRPSPPPSSTVSSPAAGVSSSPLVSSPAAGVLSLSSPLVSSPAAGVSSSSSSSSTLTTPPADKTAKTQLVISGASGLYDEKINGVFKKTDDGKKWLKIKTPDPVDDTVSNASTMSDAASISGDVTDDTDSNASGASSGDVTDDTGSNASTVSGASISGDEDTMASVSTEDSVPIFGGAGSEPNIIIEYGKGRFEIKNEDTGTIYAYKDKSKLIGSPTLISLEGTTPWKVMKVDEKQPNPTFENQNLTLAFKTPPIQARPSSSASKFMMPIIEEDGGHLLTDYRCVHFKPDQWAFYRALLRGYLLAQYINERDAADEADKPAVLAKIGRLLNKGSDYDVLNAVNVFTFDGVTITECDMIFGMLTRVTKWATYKLSIKDSPQVEGNDILSKADYYMEQMNDWFTGVSTVESSKVNAIANRNDFIKKMTQRLLKIVKSGNTPPPSLKEQLSNIFTRKNKIIPSSAPSVGGGIKNKTRRHGKHDNQTGGVPQIIKAIIGKKAKPAGSIDILKPIKRVNTNMTKEGVEMPSLPASGAGSTLLKIPFESRDNMSAEQYFEGLSMPVTIHSTTASGEKYDQVVPQVWGHPLLMYVPFARALQCNISVYAYASEEDRKTNQCKLKTLYLVDCGINNAPTIMILDENIDSDEISKFPAVLKRQDEYMSRFKLVVETEIYTAAEEASKQTGDAMFRAQEIKKNKEKIAYYRDKILKRKEKRDPIEKQLMDEVEEIVSLRNKESAAFNGINNSEQTRFLSEINTLTDEVTRIENGKAADKSNKEKGEEKKNNAVTAATAATETTSETAAASDPDKSNKSDNRDKVEGDDVKDEAGGETLWWNTAYPTASEVGTKVKDGLKKYVVDPIRSNISFTYTPERLEKKLRKLINAAKSNMEIKQTHDDAIQSIENKIQTISDNINDMRNSTST
jgi:hypothetical protein